MKKIALTIALATTCFATPAYAQCWDVCVIPAVPGPSESDLWTLGALTVAVGSVTMSIVQLEAAGDPAIGGLAAIGVVSAIANIMLGAYVMLEDTSVAPVAGAINVSAGVLNIATSAVLAATETKPTLGPVVRVAGDSAFIGIGGVTW